jgi:predicted nucleic acid-binding protein
MTVVIADTSPLNYLVLIGHIEILRGLYTRVLVPPEVLAELAGAGAPHAVLDWISAQPEWLEVRVVRQGRTNRPCSISIPESEQRFFWR